MTKKISVAILGASGYTGAELVRLLLRHPHVRLTHLTADRKVGQLMASVFPHLAPYELPALVSISSIDWTRADVDVVFCALPHGQTQTVIKDILHARPDLRVIDLSADFRLSDPDAYQKWYGHPHQAFDLQQEAVYGLAELNREEIAEARLVANPGCYTTAAQLPLIPLLRHKLIDPQHIVIDAISGVSGAGRAPREDTLFTEVSEGFHAYGVGEHRHMAELDEQFSRAAGVRVVPSFTPHLVPMNRGILATIYVRMTGKTTADTLHDALAKTYAHDPFVHVTSYGNMPQSRHVRGSNMTMIGVTQDRMAGRAILISTLDNLVKGASGQAIQNMNIMMGFSETSGLEQIALFP